MVCRIRMSDRPSIHILHRLPYALFYATGYHIGNTDRSDYRYVRNAIPSPIPHIAPTTSDAITCLGVTQFLSLYSPLYPYNIGGFLLGYADREGYPTDLTPDGRGAPIAWRYPIRFYPNPTWLSILRCRRPYRFGIYRNPTYRRLPGGESNGLS